MRDHGSAATEYMATIGLFLFVLVLCLEVYVSFSTIEKVEEAARTGARVGSMRSAAAGEAAAEDALPGWINSKQIDVRQVPGDRIECDIRARVPLLAKGVPFDVTITRRAVMPVGG